MWWRCAFEDGLDCCWRCGRDGGVRRGLQDVCTVRGRGGTEPPELSVERADVEDGPV